MGCGLGMEQGGPPGPASLARAAQARCPWCVGPQQSRGAHPGHRDAAPRGGHWSASTKKPLIVPGPLKGAGTPSVHSGGKSSATLAQGGLPSGWQRYPRGRGEYSLVQVLGLEGRPSCAAWSSSAAPVSFQNPVPGEPQRPDPPLGPPLRWGSSSHGRLPSTPGSQLAPPPPGPAPRGIF